jgi:hypothetical protein
MATAIAVEASYILSSSAGFAFLAIILPSFQLVEEDHLRSYQISRPKYVSIIKSRKPTILCKLMLQSFYSQHGELRAPSSGAARWASYSAEFVATFDKSFLSKIYVETGHKDGQVKFFWAQD